MANNAKQDKFKVSISDAQACMLCALGGFILFGTCKLATLFVSKKIGEPLMINTQAIYKNQTLQGLLYELEKQIKNIDQIGYIRFVHIIDEIANVYFKFRADATTIRPSVANECIKRYTELKNTEARRLCESFKGGSKPSDASFADFVLLINRILQQTYNYLQNIHTLAAPLQ